jgi:anthranilate synthase component 2
MSIEQVKQLQFDSIMISPGPGAPADAGITPAIIPAFQDTKPILGICLGHQAIGEFYGARLVTADRPMHGKTSAIRHTVHPIFKDIPEHVEVMRYHSLILEQIPLQLHVLAKTATGEVMAIAHVEKKIAGLQFHPESILSPYGLQMIRNWFEYIVVS